MHQDLGQAMEWFRGYARAQQAILDVGIAVASAGGPGAVVAVQMASSKRRELGWEGWVVLPLGGRCGCTCNMYLEVALGYRAGLPCMSLCFI